jgi:hypothetical protein
LVIILASFGRGLTTLSAAEAAIDNIEICPYIPNQEDVLNVMVDGSYYGSFYQVNVASAVTDRTIAITVQLTFTAGAFQNQWYASVPVGPLAVGDFTLAVSLYANGQFVESRTESVTIEPATFSGWLNKTALTSNQVSDCFPATLVHDDLLYLFWNRSYEGEVACMTYDGSGYHERGIVADCRTGSGVGAVAYAGKIFVFYSNGTYPTYHLFCREFNGGTWESEVQITNGDVYDAYGATATVYRGLLHVFWKRWQGDGVRHVYYMTFDGVSWGTPTHVVGDEYIDHPVTPIVFQDRLYLFYKHGAAYRVYDGAAWSNEATTCRVPVLSGSDGSSPAAIVADGKLVLFVLSDFGHIYAVAFDGGSWSREVRITRTPEQSFTVLDLAAASYHGHLHLIWGGIYSWASNELSAMVLPPGVPLQITSIAREGTNGVRLLWGGRGLPTKYTVESCRSLDLPNWAPVPPTNQWPIESRTWTTATADSSSARFYRVVGQ